MLCSSRKEKLAKKTKTWLTPAILSWPNLVILSTQSISSAAPCCCNSCKETRKGLHGNGKAKQKLWLVCVPAECQIKQGQPVKQCVTYLAWVSRSWSKRDKISMMMLKTCFEAWRVDRWYLRNKLIHSLHIAEHHTGPPKKPCCQCWANISRF